MALNIIRICNLKPVLVTRKLIVGMFIADLRRVCCHGRDIGVSIKDKTKVARRAKKAVFFGYVKYKSIKDIAN